MVDPINGIRDAVASAIQARTGANEAFDGFHVEPVYDRNKKYAPPLILLTITDPDVVGYTIGDDVRTDTVTVEANLIFKEGHRKTVEGVSLSRIALSDWYMAQLLETLGSIEDWPEDVLPGDPTGETNSEPQEQPYLFGCIVRLRVEYNVRVADVSY
jgi:hypothetical protein